MPMNRFEQLRHERKLTQTALQMKVEIDQTVLSKYETGERIPTTENLMVLADFYGTSMDYLMERTDVREPYPRKRK